MAVLVIVVQGKEGGGVEVVGMVFLCQGGFNRLATKYAIKTSTTVIPAI
jgi:hypothetical protein